MDLKSRSFFRSIFRSRDSEFVFENHGSEEEDDKEKIARQVAMRNKRKKCITKNIESADLCESLQRRYERNLSAIASLWHYYAIIDDTSRYNHSDAFVITKALYTVV